MADFETMPIGTANALRDAALLFRSYEAHHGSEADKLEAMHEDDLADAVAQRRAKAIRNADMAKRLETLLAQKGQG